MVRECFKANTGIMFVSDALREIGLDPATLYPFVLPRPPPLPLKSSDGKVQRIRNFPAKEIPIKPHAYLKKKFRPDHEIPKLLAQAKIPFLGTEEEEELHDSLSPKYDQLNLAKSWWSLEILPLRLRYQRSDNEWVNTIGLVLVSLDPAAPLNIPYQLQPCKTSLYPLAANEWIQSAQERQTSHGSRIRG